MRINYIMAYFTRNPNIYKNAADTEFRSNRLIPTGQNGTFTEKDLKKFIIKYHPNKLRDSNLKNNEAFSNRVKAIIEDKTSNNPFLIGYKPLSRPNFRPLFSSIIQGPTGANVDPNEFWYMNTTGKYDQWQCCNCGMIFNGKYIKNKCTMCGTLRGEGCNENKRFNDYDKPTKNQSFSRSGRLVSRGKRRATNHSQLLKEVEKNKNNRRRNSMNNMNNNFEQEMANAYQQFKSGEAGIGGSVKKSMKCKNDKSKTYNGSEKSPKGKGYCAHPEKIGTKKKGNDGNMWEVKKTSNGIKRWFKVKSKK